MDTIRNGAFGLANTNKLIRFYKGATGMKTGFTDEAKYCLSGTAERNGMQLIAVVLGASTSDIRFSTAKSLLDYGFSLYKETVLSGRLSYEIPVCGGESPSVRVSSRENPTALLPTNHGEIRVVTEIPRFLYAGVYEGDVIGRAVFYADGAEVGEALLYAESSVQIARKEKSFWKRIISFLNGRKKGIIESKGIF